MSSCCSVSNRCGVSEGDCDNDGECHGHLLCGTDNCFPPFHWLLDWVPIICSTHAITSSTDLGAIICSTDSNNKLNNRSYNKLDNLLLENPSCSNKLDTFLNDKLCYNWLDSYCCNKLDSLFAV